MFKDSQGKWHHTEEENRKTGKAQKGKYVSEKTRQKMSRALKGRNVWNKGTKGVMKPNKTSFKKGNCLSEETKLKMSKAMKGRVITWGSKISEATKGHEVSEETRRKLSKSLVGLLAGEKNPNWGKRGPETSSWIDGRSFLPYPVGFNRQLKELIRSRDNYQCQKCGMPERENMRKLDIHHIDYNKENCLPSNLIALCKSCNSLVNKNRKYWQCWFNQKMEVKLENNIAS